MACENHTETREILREVESSTKSAHHRLDTHEKRLDSQDSAISALSKNDERQTVQIDNVCKQMSSLTKAIWGLTSGIFFVLLGFFVWYVQNIKK